MTRKKKHNHITPETKPDIFRRVLLNGSVIAFARLIVAVVALVAIPVVLKKLGLGGLGVWETLFAFSALITMALGALSNTVLWKVSGTFLTNDKNKAVRYIRIGNFFLFVVAICISPLFYITIPYLEKGVIFEEVYYTDAIRILPHLVLITLLNGLNLVRGAGLQGFHQSGVVALINTISKIGNYGLSILGLSYGFGIWSLLWGFFFEAIFLFIAFSLLCWYTFGATAFFPLLPTQEEFSSLAKYCGFLLIGTCSAALRGQTDRLVLAAFASSAWVGIYGIAARLGHLVMEVSNFSYVPTIAASGSLTSDGNWPEVQRLYSRMMKIVPFAIGCVVITLIGVQREVQFFWLQEYIPEAVPFLWWILLGNASAVIITGPGTSILKGIGNLKIETVYIVLNLLLNLLCTVLFVWIFGPIGTVISSGTTWAFTSCVFILLMHRNYDLPKQATINAFVSMFIITLLAFGLWYGTNTFVSLPKTRLGALLQGILCGTPVLLVFSVIMLKISHCNAISFLRILTAKSSSLWSRS